jgi:hypothetical protein
MEYLISRLPGHSALTLIILPRSIVMGMMGCGFTEGILYPDVDILEP